MTIFAQTTSTTSRFQLKDKCRSEKWEVYLYGDMTIKVMGSRRAENCGVLRSCSSWRDGKAFFGRVHRYTARGFPRHQGGEGVAGTPGACSQVFCHPIRCISCMGMVKHTHATISPVPPPQPPQRTNRPAVGYRVSFFVRGSAAYGLTRVFL